ncbi:MAG: hypothetical protein H6823_11145 [Planctomycetaceae bacterium]|nr:hypothetical protein [Planctomycetales bacterium]MCB9938790.1 hypothetical protein [Planctomycetaceae bacterium]
MEAIPEQLAARIVGFLEYGMALQSLDRLVATASEKELAVIDEIVKDRDEFVVMTNLASQYESELLRTPQSNNIRRGLAWVMALARVELGAMRAGFTDVRNPFELVPPSRYEFAEYVEIMVDSARTHYLALGNDPNAHLYARWNQAPIKPGRMPTDAQVLTERQAIAYARRTVLASQFVDAVESLGKTQLSADQYVQLQQAKQHLASLKSAIVYRVLGLGIEVSSGTNTALDGGTVLGPVTGLGGLPPATEK